MYKEILLALLSGLIAAVLTSIASYWIYAHQIKSSRDSILMGIAGEVESIKGVLEKQLRTAKKAEVDGNILNKYTFYYPREYYDSIIADVGKLNNKNMVRKIVMAYSLAERVKDQAERLDSGVTNKDSASHKYYREELEMTFVIFMKTFLSLEPYLAKYPDEDWKINVPEWYTKNQDLLKQQPSCFEFVDGEMKKKGM